MYKKSFCKIAKGAEFQVIKAMVLSVMAIKATKVMMKELQGKIAKLGEFQVSKSMHVMKTMVAMSKKSVSKATKGAVFADKAMMKKFLGTIAKYAEFQVIMLMNAMIDWSNAIRIRQTV